MPSSEPASILTDEYQTVGERAITRAATGRVACGKPVARLSLSRPRSWAASRSAVADRPSCSRRPSTSALSFLFSSLASKESPNQPNRSRKGFSALPAPVSSGANAVWAPRWRAPKGPPDSPNEAVSMTIERTMKIARAALLLRTTLLSNIQCRLRGAGLTTPLVSGILVGAVNGLELLEAAAGPDCDARER